ncbi:UNVERIFIED_CONTAM: hypothetical protein Slati_1332600 [Sesamum latifolium]|uniref:Uncharacterized protein n=1 Tax=Sesamum latifolium TaxID=2727402 RepID=A0AAW2XIP0_9LAMI
MHLAHNLETRRCIPRWQEASSLRLGIMALRMSLQRPSHPTLTWCIFGARFIVVVFYASPK